MTQEKYISVLRFLLLALSEAIVSPRVCTRQYLIELTKDYALRSNVTEDEINYVLDTAPSVVFDL